MTLREAFRYFLGEALTNIRRSWRISLLAVLSIASSLFISGIFLLLGDNLSRIAAEWRSEAKLLIYLADGAEGQSERIRLRILERPWVTGVEAVSSAEAERRFETIFPGLTRMLDGWEGQRLPASLEVGVDPDRVESETLDSCSWVASLRELPGVRMVDDDREWLRQLEALVAVLRGVGLTLGLILLSAAAFTIASVVRLTAHLYREEMGIMRLVGATEFLVRGPFVVEGLVQGAVGGLVGVVALFVAYSMIAAGSAPALFGSLLFGRFLPPAELLILVLVGAAAGLAGSLLSLRAAPERGR